MLFTKHKNRQGAVRVRELVVHNFVFLIYTCVLTLLAAYLYFFPYIHALSDGQDENIPSPSEIEKLFSVCDCPFRIALTATAMYAAGLMNHNHTCCAALGVFVPLYIASLHDLEDMYVYDIVVLSALPSAISIGLNILGPHSILFGISIGFVFFLLSRTSYALGEGDIMPAGIIGMITSPQYLHVVLVCAGTLGTIYAIAKKTRVVPLVPFLSIGGLVAFIMTVQHSH